MVDIDKFKTINDRHGHPTGDAVLRAVAGSLESTLRASDYVFRYGGDEMLFLLPETDHRQSIDKAESIGRRVRDQAVTAGKDTIRITLSIGVATYPDHGQDRRTLVEAADQAVYQAKTEGRDRACLATPHCGLRQGGT